MTTKLYLTISALISLVYGVVFLFLPGQSLALYGVTSEPHVNAALQFFGGTLIPLGLVTWFARDFLWTAARNVLISLVVGDVLFIALSIFDMQTGVINAMGWSTVILDVLLVVGAGYCLMNTSADASRVSQRAA